MPTPKCPECEKLAAVSDKSQSIGEFLEWMANEKGIILATWGNEECEDCGTEIELPVTVHTTTEAFLAEYFKIDMNKVEIERRALLQYLRDNNQPDEPKG